MNHSVKVKPLQSLFMIEYHCIAQLFWNFFKVPTWTCPQNPLLPPRKCYSFTVHYDTWQTSFVIAFISLFSVKWILIFWTYIYLRKMYFSLTYGKTSWVCFFCSELLYGVQWPYTLCYDGRCSSVGRVLAQHAQGPGLDP